VKTNLTRPPLAIVVAMAQNRTIGIDNRLPWRCPEDLQHFKALTMGHHLIMGRKTFDSIGKPLPGRTTVVVTRNPDWQAAGCQIAHSLEEAIGSCPADRMAFVVGGAELYAQALPAVSTLYVTEIQQDMTGDAYFPAFDPADWQEVESRTSQQVMPQPLHYRFVTYRRQPSDLAAKN